MTKLILLTGLVLLLGSTLAHAVTYEELPESVTTRLPGFILKRIDPAKMKYLTVADFCEFADAYDSGVLRFVNNVCIEESGGPLTPDLAELVLQIPPQAPYVKDRFTRIAKWAYGKGIFAELRWSVTINPDESVDIHLWYKSANPKSLLPEASYSGIGHAQVGVHYRDLYYGLQDKQVDVELGTSSRERDELTGDVSWADNTLNGGANAVSVKLQVQNEWRGSLSGKPNQATWRDRIAEADAGYTWTKEPGIGTHHPRLTLGTGAYQQDHWVYTGDPTDGGNAPGASIPQAGSARYVSLDWTHDTRDHFSLPRSGSYTNLRFEQHFGDWNFARYVVDMRRYKPVRDIFGVTTPCVQENGCEGQNDIALQLPPACIAVQAHVDVHEGEMPWSQEIRLNNTDLERGYSYDLFPGVRVASLREEYRFALDAERHYEMYFFNDNAWVGENVHDLQTLSSLGAGAIMRLPFFNKGLKVGAYYGHSILDDTMSSGLSLGYAF